MVKDVSYTNLKYEFSGVEHRYSENVHILGNPYTQSLLTKLCRPETVQPELNQLVAKVYHELLIETVNLFFPRITETVETRMKEFIPQGELDVEIIDRETRAVCVNLARAGTWPSHMCFDELSTLLKPANVRQDHFFMNRKTNDAGEVIGVDVSGSKIGGDIDKTIVLFPDPMGATGGSLSHAIDHYKNNVEGKELLFVALHLIITPEFVKTLSEKHPEVKIMTLRLDRGLSDSEVLSTVPGTHPEKERGLTDIQYIVPGAGGVGEILNNSFV